MPEVFINYRTGDGDETAALIDEYLSNRFGAERIFRAGKSIPPGQDFRDALIGEVCASMALLAIIGPAWSRHPRLRGPDDWVRREILAAFAQGVSVIPVLKGRMTPRLDPADLPTELNRLANTQSLVLDTRDNRAGLARIGDELADLVPTLSVTDRAVRKIPKSGTTDNAVGSANGTVFQSRDIDGDDVNIAGNHGPVHVGSGDIYDGRTRITGDNYGGISHHFGGSRRDEDKR